LRASQIEEHNIDSAMMGAQRSEFAMAAAAQKATLAAHPGGSVAAGSLLAPQLATAETVIDRTQAATGYDPALSTNGSSSPRRRVLNEL
jgi:hypothetical protein